MKIIEVAPFFFQFMPTTEKNKSYELLENFLRDNNWLNQRGDKILPLTSYHTDESVTCHVLLTNDCITEEFIDQTEELFDNLISQVNIKWIKVGYYPATEGIIYNNIDKYSHLQTIPIQDMAKGDTMFVFYKK